MDGRGIECRVSRDWRDWIVDRRVWILAGFGFGDGDWFYFDGELRFARCGDSIVILMVKSKYIEIWYNITLWPWPSVHSS